MTNGRLVLKTEVGTLTVYGAGVSAVFKLLRVTDQGKTAVELRMVKGDFSVCKSAFRLSSAASPPKKTVRRLWAQGKGRFRTRGRYSAAAVRGTNWLTADRCDGTLTPSSRARWRSPTWSSTRRCWCRPARATWRRRGAEPCEPAH